MLFKFLYAGSFCFGNRTMSRWNGIRIPVNFDGVRSDVVICGAYSYKASHLDRYSRILWRSSCDAFHGESSVLSSVLKW